MKIKIIDGYHILHTETDAPVYCNKRTPTFVPVPSRGLAGSMDIATMQGPVHYCGDHCPFFSGQGTMFEIKCNITYEPLVGTATFEEVKKAPILKM